MTANELAYRLELKFDSMFEYAAPAYDDKQLSVMLSNAQERVIDDLVKFFEASEKVRTALKHLIKPASVSNGEISVSASQTGVHPVGIFYDLPGDTRHLVEEAVKLSGISKETTVKPVTHDFYMANINNPYKKPSKDVAWRMDISRLTDSDGTSTLASSPRVEIITDGTGITDYRVRYLRQPPNIIVDKDVPANQKHCVLDESVHDKIVDEAIKMMKASTTPEHYQIARAEAEE